MKKVLALTSWQKNSYSSNNVNNEEDRLDTQRNSNNVTNEEDRLDTQHKIHILLTMPITRNLGLVSYCKLSYHIIHSTDR